MVMPLDQETVVCTGVSAGSGESGTDQSSHAAPAALTAGLSLLAQRLAFADWVDHSLLSPDKHTALLRRPGRSWQSPITYAAQAWPNLTCPDYFEPLPQDHRFNERRGRSGRNESRAFH